MFDVAATSYDAFMGRYSRLLAGPMADLAGLTPTSRVIDVGCGPGALTGELVRRVGAANVAAVDPSEAFVAATAARYPGVDTHVAGAEALPYPAATFDAALAQLVVHFMRDPLGGIQEMARITRPGGVLVASVWDFAGGRSPLTPFWNAVAALDPGNSGESTYVGARQGQLVDLFREAGLRDVEEHALEIELTHSSFEDWWAPFTAGVGPAGSHARSLDPERRAELRRRIEADLPSGAFTIHAAAWAARGVVA